MLFSISSFTDLLSVVYCIVHNNTQCTLPLGKMCSKEGQAWNRYGLQGKTLFMGAHAAPDLWQCCVSLAQIWNESPAW